MFETYSILFVLLRIKLTFSSEYPVQQVAKIIRKDGTYKKKIE